MPFRTLARREGISKRLLGVRAVSVPANGRRRRRRAVGWGGVRGCPGPLTPRAAKFTLTKPSER
ncbi:hypothetical protein GCM10010517_75490 [Streptosporangium fragile]|uniref:Uncharacterized protein n=1 Tax=Streptosporangium fragile TaxID=46186 RepID=A0ABN3WC44_9ACTN